MANKPTIHVDMQGTLFQLQLIGSKMGWGPNAGLITVLGEAAQAGHPIVFHTGGDPDTMTKDILRTVQDERLHAFLPVVSKRRMRGMVVDIAIDDEQPHSLRNQYGIDVREHVPAATDGMRPISNAEHFRTHLARAVAAIEANPTPAPAPAPAAVAEVAAPASFNKAAQAAPKSGTGWLQRVSQRLGLS